MACYLALEFQDEDTKWYKRASGEYIHITSGIGIAALCGTQLGNIYLATEPDVDLMLGNTRVMSGLPGAVRYRRRVGREAHLGLNVIWAEDVEDS